TRESRAGRMNVGTERLVCRSGIVLACLLLASTLHAGQDGGGLRRDPVAGCPGVSREFYPCARAKARTFNPPRNPDGTPNMNGAWNPSTANGSQNIEDYPGDQFLGAQISLIVDPPDGK